MANTRGTTSAGLTAGIPVPEKLRENDLPAHIADRLKSARIKAIEKYNATWTWTSGMPLLPVHNEPPLLHRQHESWL